MVKDLLLRDSQSSRCLQLITDLTAIPIKDLTHHLSLKVSVQTHRTIALHSTRKGVLVVRAWSDYSATAQT